MLLLLKECVINRRVFFFDGGTQSTRSECE
jgi:hypothetical protein